jgi:hypothetical protein
LGSNNARFSDSSLSVVQHRAPFAKGRNDVCFDLSNSKMPYRHVFQPTFAVSRWMPAKNRESHACVCGIAKVLRLA